MAENSDLTSNIFNFFYDPNLIINIPDKPVGWEKPVAVPSFTSFHFINVEYFQFLGKI